MVQSTLDSQKCIPVSLAKHYRRICEPTPFSISRTVSGVLSDAGGEMEDSAVNAEAPFVEEPGIELLEPPLLELRASLEVADNVRACSDSDLVSFVLFC